SGRSFAYSFLRTPPRDDALAVRLAVPVIKARRGLSPPSRPPRHHSGTGQPQIMSLSATPCGQKDTHPPREAATRHPGATKKTAPGDRRRFAQLRLRPQRAGSGRLLLASRGLLVRRRLLL